MELFETLNQFKKITPNVTRTEISKRAILAQTPLEPRASFSGGATLGIRRTLAAIFETGFAVALTVFFILIIIGKFPGQQSVAPVQLSVINPTTLQAEAQAVDIQIQLAQIAYTETTSTAESTPETTAAIAAKQPTLAVAAAATSTATGGANASSSGSGATTTISIDQALQELSQ